MQNIYINHISPPTGEAGERIEEKDTNCKGTKGKKEEIVQSTSPEERNRY
jgi:hypothetical protein